MKKTPREGCKFAFVPELPTVELATDIPVDTALVVTVAVVLLLAIEGVVALPPAVE